MKRVWSKVFHEQIAQDVAYKMLLGGSWRQPLVAILGPIEATSHLYHAKGLNSEPVFVGSLVLF
jgi:hypothetical protein